MVGLDFRIGCAFAPNGHGLNASVELTSIDDGKRLNTVALLLGYQGF